MTLHSNQEKPPTDTGRYVYGYYYNDRTRTYLWVILYSRHGTRLTEPRECLHLMAWLIGEEHEMDLLPNRYL